MGTGGPSPGVKRGRGVTLTTHPHLVSRSIMSRSYMSFPLAPAWPSGTVLLSYFILKDLKKSCFLSRLLLYVQLSPALLTLKSYRKMKVFEVEIVSDTSHCKSKFKIMCNSTMVCADFNIIYI
jgi:hypothetical protein